VSHTLWLDVAGLTLEVTSDADLPIAAEGSARKFVAAAPAQPASARLHARWGDPRVPADGQMAFDSGKGLWRLYRTPRGHEVVFTSPALGPEPYQAATFREDFREATVTLRRAPFADRLPIYPLHYPLDELFMVHLLSRGLGVEVHSSGVVLPDGRGWLFVGVSGAGKSTLSRLWRGEPDVTVLSDERIILRRQGGSLWMYGTPWHGDGYIAEPGCARLERVFFLRQGPRNVLAPFSVTDSVARLFLCGFAPFHDAAGLAFSLGFLEEVARGCRCEELSFLPDRTVIDFLRDN
jgi:hypothetical protein